MSIDSHAEILRLRTALRDLVALSTIPAAWVGREPPAIAAGLADVLVGSLHLGFAFVRLCEPNGGALVEVARGDAWKGFPEWLERHLAAIGHFLHKEIVPNVGGDKGPCRGIVMPVGVNAEGGLVAAACDRTDFPTEIDQLLLSMAANHAATAFQNSRLIYERRSAEEALRKREQELLQIRDELERKVAERTAELRRSETYLAEAQRLTHTGSWAYNPASGNVIYWSEEMFRIHGLDPHRSRGVPDRDEFPRLLHPDDGERVREVFEKAVREKADFQGQYKVVHSDGAVRCLHVTGHPVLDETGDVATYVGIAVDVTDRKRAQEELMQKASLLDLTHDTIFVRDLQDVIRYWNRGAEELYGWTSAEAIGRVTHDLMETVFPAPLDEITAELFRMGRWEGELVHRKHDGSRIIVASRWSLQRDEHVRPVAVLETNHDITARKRTEEELRRSEAYLTDAQKLTHTGSWSRNPLTGKVLYCSEETLRIFAFDPREGLPTAEAFAERTHPEDREKVLERVEKAARQKDDYVSDFRIVFPDGTVRYIESIGHPVFNTTEDIAEYVGTVVDVTERKRAEEELRESEKRYRYIFDTAGVSIWEEDFSLVKAAIDDLKAQGVQDFCLYMTAHPEFVGQAIPMVKIVDVNHATVSLLGAECKDELLISLDKIFLPETEDVFTGELIAIAEGRTSFESEAVVQTLKGDKLTVLITITFPPQPTRYERVLVSLVDITERKRVEQRLIVQHHVTRILAEAASLQDAAPRILEAICESLIWDVAALWTVDKQAELLRCVKVWHKDSMDVSEFEGETHGATFKRGIGLPGRVWFSGEPAYIPDIVHDAKFLRARVTARQVLHAAFGFPILLGREVLGVMEFFSHEIRPLDHDLLDMMATIGSQIGQFIERKRAEETVRKTQLELAHVARVATLGELTASIAHEINQPLGAIVNNAGACLRWLAAHNMEEARQSAEHVIRDGHRASQIISRIRALVQKTPPQKDWMDINETIREVLALTRTEMEGHRVAVQMQLSDELAAVLADRIQVQQVLLNMIMNGIEAMGGASEGSRNLLVRSNKHDVQHVVVTVQDSGPGIDAAHLDHLFEPFYSTKPRGLGMGLAISRSIIEAHGGRLWATANERRGATFRFTLPVNGDRTV